MNKEMLILLSEWKFICSDEFCNLYNRRESDAIEIFKFYVNEFKGNIPNKIFYSFSEKFLECYLSDLELSFDEELGDAISVLDSSGDSYNIGFDYLFDFIKENDVETIIEAKSDFNQSLFLEEDLEGL